MSFTYFPYKASFKGGLDPHCDGCFNFETVLTECYKTMLFRLKVIDTTEVQSFF